MAKVAPTSRQNAPATRYALVPLDLLRDPGLSDAAKLLYAELDGRVTSKERQQVRQDTVAVNLGWSLRKVQRASAQLVKAGHITVQRTRASSVYSVVNPVRKPSTGHPRDTAGHLGHLGRHAEKPPVSGVPDSGNTSPIPAISGGSHLGNDTSGVPDTTPAAGTYRNTSYINNSRQEAVYQTRSARGYTANSTTAAAVNYCNETVESYLQAITEATGHTIEANRATRPLIERIQSAGISAQDTAHLVNASLAAGNGSVTNPPGFIVKVVLPELAGNPCREPSPTPSPTPTPPSLAEIQTATPCKHGEIRGQSGCALCRTQPPASPPTPPPGQPVKKSPAAPTPAPPDLHTVLLDKVNAHLDTWRESGRHVDWMRAKQTAQEIAKLPHITADHAEAMDAWLDNEMRTSLAATGAA